MNLRGGSLMRISESPDLKLHKAAVLEYTCLLIFVGCMYRGLQKSSCLQGFQEQLSFRNGRAWLDAFPEAP